VVPTDNKRENEGNIKLSKGLWEAESDVCRFLATAV
jgi:hypothetical protein